MFRTILRTGFALCGMLLFLTSAFAQEKTHDGNAVPSVSSSSFDAEPAVTKEEAVQPESEAVENPKPEIDLEAGNEAREIYIDAFKTWVRNTADHAKHLTEEELAYVAAENYNDLYKHNLARAEEALANKDTEQSSNKTK